MSKKSDVSEPEKSDASEPEKSDTGNLTIDAEHHVNEVTLELLERRIESNVRSNFLKTVTLPIGGGGILAIFVAAFLWIPKQIENFLGQPSTQAVVEQHIRQQVTDHFQSEQTQNELEARVARVTSAQMKERVDAAVLAYFSDDGRGGKLVKEWVNAAVQDYITDEGKGGKLVSQTVQQTAQDLLIGNDGKGEVQRLVKEYMGNEGEKLIVDQIDRLIRPALVALLKPLTKPDARVGDNLGRLVQQVQPMQIKGESKSDSMILTLPAQVVHQIQTTGDPVILDIQVGARSKFELELIRDCFTSLQRNFERQFDFVAVSYLEGKQHKLIALIPASEFQSKLDTIDDEYVELLNSAGDPKVITPEAVQRVRQKLVQWFGEGVVKRIQADSQVLQVLKSELWSLPPDLDEEVSVLNSNGVLLGLTSRGRIIYGMLEFQYLN